jgi:hypothetical protein
MALFSAKFERTNYSLQPALTQTADVLLQTDIPFDDANLGAFERALWNAMWAQNPHWRDSRPPAGLCSNWSDVMGGTKIERIHESDTLNFAWHVTSGAWLKGDGTDTTEDVEEAGQFPNSAILELQARNPGPRFPLVMAKPVREVYDEAGPILGGCCFQLRYDEYVIWGRGPRLEGCERVSPSAVTWTVGRLVTRRAFTLPKFPDAQEYERKTCWAWRLSLQDDWALADSADAAEADARKFALASMQETGAHDCSAWLAIKHNKKVTNALDGSDL